MSWTMVPIYILAYCRAIVGLIFVTSSVSKARGLDEFKRSIKNFELLPHQFTNGAALLFIGAELTVAVLMVIGGSLLLSGFLLAIFLLLLFSSAMGSVLARKILTYCNCFGSSKKLISSVDVWRNAGFILWALIGWVMLNLTKESQGQLGLIEWILIVLGASVYIVVWIQLGEIVQIFRQSQIQP